VAPQAARPLVLAGQRLVRQGEPAQALALWTPLMGVHPEAFAVIAGDYAAAAQACGQIDAATEQLRLLHSRVPSVDVLNALLRLQVDPAARRTLLLAHLQRQPSLSAALGLLREQGEGPLPADQAQAVQQAVQSAAKPLQRYRCAACGFEAQQYFWQCPGCHGWDTYPPRRLEDH
jgi:lipopolysaccharide biosynthesis regulator YciM